MLAGGRSRFVCIYETTQQILLKKFQVICKAQARRRQRAKIRGRGLHKPHTPTHLPSKATKPTVWRNVATHPLPLHVLCTVTKVCFVACFVASCPAYR